MLQVKRKADVRLSHVWCDGGRRGSLKAYRFLQATKNAVEPVHVRRVPRCSELSLACSADGAAIGRISSREIRLAKEGEQEGANKVLSFLHICTLLEALRRGRDSQLVSISLQSRIRAAQALQAEVGKTTASWKWKMEIRERRSKKVPKIEGRCIHIALHMYSTYKYTQMVLTYCYIWFEGPSPLKYRYVMHL